MDKLKGFSNASFLKTRNIKCKNHTSLLITYRFYIIICFLSWTICNFTSLRNSLDFIIEKTETVLRWECTWWWFYATLLNSLLWFSQFTKKCSSCSEPRGKRHVCKSSVEVVEWAKKKKKVVPRNVLWPCSRCFFFPLRVEYLICVVWDPEFLCRLGC